MATPTMSPTRLGGDDRRGSVVAEEPNDDAHDQFACVTKRGCGERVQLHAFNSRDCDRAAAQFAAQCEYESIASGSVSRSAVLSLE